MRGVRVLGRGRDRVEVYYVVGGVELVWRLGLGGQFRYCGGGGRTVAGCCALGVLSRYTM